jgi:hypothetical protein
LALAQRVFRFSDIWTQLWIELIQLFKLNFKTCKLKIKIAYISQFETNSIGVYNQFIGWLEMKFEINIHQNIIRNHIRWLV